MTQEDFKGVKGIIFDYGGTLDSGGDHWSEVIWDAYVRAGVDVSKEQFRDAYVYAERELARTRHILPEHDFLDLLRIKINIELQYLANHDLFPPQLIAPKSEEAARICHESAMARTARAREVLDRLKDKYPMVLVSNFYGNVHSVLKGYGLDDCFKDIIESAVVGVRKPDPQIFNLGVEALGLTPEETVVIGDSLKKDILPAESIGCRVIWLKGKGWTPEEDAATHPAAISDLSEVLPLLGC